MKQSEERRRLRWRCRRGMLELDTILQAFLDEQYGGLSPQEQRAFQRLLTLPDTLLIAYCQGTQEPDDIELTNIVRKLQ